MSDDKPEEPPESSEEPSAEVIPIKKRLRSGPKQRVLTDDTIDRLVFAFTACAYVPDACAYAGISESWFGESARRGRAYAEHIDLGGEIIDGEDIYLRLALQTDKARSEAKVSALASLRTAWETGDWRAALAYLERNDPAHWQRLQRVEMSGPHGGPVQFDITIEEQELAESIKARPLVLEAEAVAEVVTAATAAIVMPDDDDEDYYVLPYAEPAFDFDVEE